MEELKENKQFKLLFIIFCIITAIHIIYASLTFRAMYEDGGFYMLQILNNLSNGIYTAEYDTSHSGFCISYLMQLPVFFLYAVFHLQNKFALMFSYSFFQFFLPFAAVLWNFALTKRTKRIDVLFWNIFFYGAILCVYMIFSVAETLIGVTLHFILWNYLSSNIDYKKRDILFIIFLLVMMFGTYEYAAYLGIIFFLAHFHYVVHEESVNNRKVKTLIGFGSLVAAIFNIIFMLNTGEKLSGIIHFPGEATDYLPHIFELNSLFSVLTLILIVIFMFRKDKITNRSLIYITALFIFAFVYLMSIPLSSIYPMWEQHLRTIPCWACPLIFTGFYIKDMVSNKIETVKYSNLICIALICCIFQTSWQMVDTFYWNKNIEYMKSELEKADSLLYIPSEHEEISSLHNKELRRYIWHGMFAATSIVFSDTYKQKTLLVNYDEQQDIGSGNFRNLLYVIENSGKMSVPFGTLIDIKNKFWDLTDCAQALDDYNKENKIETKE